MGKSTLLQTGGHFILSPECYRLLFPAGIEKIPDRKLVSIKDELSSRCHLASWSDPCSLRSAFTLPATDVCLHVTEYSAILRYTFDCALGGPFDSLHFHPDRTIPELSVGAPLPLSPLRPSVCLLFIFYKNTTFLCVCQQKYSISYSFYLIHHYYRPVIGHCTK